MSFQTGTATTIENLLQTLSTFLQANGWTEDFANTGDPGTIGFSKGGIFVSFQYSETASGGDGTMAMYQALAADQSPTTDPWTATDDSGNGRQDNTPNNFDNSRCVNMFAGPYTAYWFFEGKSPDYCHVVVEVDAGRYRHFGFGELDKIGDWVGGEYAYAHFWEQAAAQIDSPTAGAHTIGMDSVANLNNTFPATIHVEGFTNEPNVNTKWAIAMNGAGGTDSAGVARWRAKGCWRNTREFQVLHAFRISLASAYTPLCPMPVELFDPTQTPDFIWRIGFQPDVRMCNIALIDPNQIINVGGDDWYFFPWVRKQNLNNDTEESMNAGVAYKRVNA